MSPISEAILSSWSLDLIPALGLTVVAALYLRGWRILHRVLPARFTRWRLGAFLGGLSTLWLAIASPLDAFAGLLLSAHMVQHLLLMSVAPPLLLLGAPALPLLRGLPRSWAHDGFGPFLAWPALQRVGSFLISPRVGWLALVASLVVWHVPAAFQLALVSPTWHRWEHICFLTGALLFWWPVVSPFPSRPPWPEWALALYLLAADVVNTALCAILTFSDRVLYPVYENAPRLWRMSALNDQVAAGVIMWVPGSLVFLVPAVVLMIRGLSPRHTLTRPSRAVVEQTGTASRRAVPSHSTASVTRNFDVLKLPLVGRILRSASGRRCAQAVSLVIAIAVIVDGLLGSPVSSDNLAGIVPWIDWRALTVIALLVVGNVFCFACPFMLPRELGRLLGWNSHAWPRRWRSKWLAVALLVIFFWAYEAFDLWGRPRATAWIVLSYFVGALVVDAWFKGASFCKYACPIGQFQFVISLVSPMEVKVRQPDACSRCQTHDCLRGNSNQRGCELDLYLPRKTGSLDCTFCLDCVRACPHDNIGILAVAPALHLTTDRHRAGLGRLSRRLDVAALVLIVIFAGFASAAAMTQPITTEWNKLALHLGLRSPILVIGAWFVLTLVILPLAVFGGVVPTSRMVARLPTTWREVFCRFSLALVPLGAAMWGAHVLFHFLSGPSVIGPWLNQKFAQVWISAQKSPAWEFRQLVPNPDTVLFIQAALLGAGFLLALYLIWRLMIEVSPRGRPVWVLIGSWGAIATVLYAVGIWICLQPMSLRGMGNP
ncbi:MAG TPA: cytochrome c oxidase assembly protein [Verrucomicrobiota bacterium]|nr:cytochrome c oxidase assembly protein [Verrucomicrobiota bacterium]